MSSTPTTTPARQSSRVLGRTLEAILDAPRAELPFIHVTARASNVPPPRALRFTEVRETGPRSGISFRLGHTTDRPLRTDGELSAVSVSQFMPRAIAAKSATEYVHIYKAGPHYGSRCRVLARKADTITVQHPASGDVLTVAACDTEAAR